MTLPHQTVLIWFAQMKSEAGFAGVAGVELSLLDCARYFQKTAGINSVAQIARDLGAKADPDKLTKAAKTYQDLPRPTRIPLCTGLGTCWTALVTRARPRSWNP